ncbi:uncharacterized protein F4817DRAFT_319693 [Daldinia loculata]|uniref:uncharacterized protein n=1 Tax=Daldinia loculata TaxID=103429 RepID=UPI0020C3C2F9|nr:uncharacterized protein F4817DRAFT_319693 [Daldinia loculata]KAI1643584.1 hypothetical protein F4817DRAFT_319693 [Daldinia loculata]
MFLVFCSSITYKHYFISREFIGISAQTKNPSATTNTGSITRGNWNHRRIRKNFKFVGDARHLGLGLGLEATFQSEAKKSSKEAIDNFSKTAESGMRILGIDIQPSKSNTSSFSTSKSDVKFDSDNGKISICPESDLNPIVLGILGSKIRL